jgi:hypothetical protein
MAEKFEDLRAWQTARTLTNNVYALSKQKGWKDDWALKTRSVGQQSVRCPT